MPEGTPEVTITTHFVQNELGKPTEGVSASQGRVGAHILVTVTQSGRIEAGGFNWFAQCKAHYSFNLFGSQFDIFESTDIIPVTLIVQNTGKIT